MSREIVTVAIVTYNASIFIEVSLDALKKLTKNKYIVIICDNGSHNSDKEKLKKIASKYKNIELIFRKQSGPTSMGHAEALNVLIERINTPYGIILDSDSILLKKYWDEILINQLDAKTKIIGCPPAKNPLKPIDFPSVYATLFDTKIFKSLKIDMRPKDPSIGLDTGWEMREKFLAKKYKAKNLEVKSTREYKKGPFKNVVCAECYLDDDIIVSHFGRGSSLGMAKYKGWWKIPIIRKMKGYYERDKWIKTCKNIVNGEFYDQSL
jgi:glycosyltransferase involved in cell wall biosynthesis